jgi:hypothetical protein
MYMYVETIWTGRHIVNLMKTELVARVRVRLESVSSRFRVTKSSGRDAVGLSSPSLSESFSNADHQAPPYIP